MKIVVDTNLLIDFSRTSLKQKEKILWTGLVKFAKTQGHQLILPAIAVFEFFAGREMELSSNQKKVDNILEDVVILDLTEEVAKEAARLFRKYKESIGVIDYILVATAICYKAELATLNFKHFKIFKELNLFDFQKIKLVQYPHGS